jgi:hypothetical protein
MPTKGFRHHKRRNEKPAAPLQAAADGVGEGLSLSPPPPGSFVTGVRKVPANTAAADPAVRSSAPALQLSREETLSAAVDSLPSASSSAITGESAAKPLHHVDPSLPAAFAGSAGRAKPKASSSLSSSSSHVVKEGLSPALVDDDDIKKQWEEFLRLKQSQKDHSAVGPTTGSTGEDPPALGIHHVSERAAAVTPAFETVRPPAASAATPCFETVRASSDDRSLGAAGVASPIHQRPTGQSDLLQRMQQRGIEQPPSLKVYADSATSHHPPPQAEQLPQHDDDRDESPEPTLAASKPELGTAAGPPNVTRSESYRTAEQSQVQPEQAATVTAPAPSIRTAASASSAAVASSVEAERCFFIVTGLASHPRVKLKLAPETPLASLFGYFFAKVEAPAVVQQRSMFVWNGQTLDGSKTPLDYGMGRSVANVNAVRIVPRKEAGATPTATPSSVHPTVGPRATGGDSVEQVHELQLQLQIAQAKSELLEFQLKRKESSPPPSAALAASSGPSSRSPPAAVAHAPAAAAAVGPRTGIPDDRHGKQQKKDAADEAMRVDFSHLHKEKAHRPKEEKNGTKDEARRWKELFDEAVREIVELKVLVAQQQACLDRLGVPHPLPLAFVGSAYVKKSYDFDECAGWAFSVML